MKFLILPAAFLVALPLQAQNEAVLRQAFEGKIVSVKIDMPASTCTRSTRCP